MCGQSGKTRIFLRSTTRAGCRPRPAQIARRDRRLRPRSWWDAFGRRRLRDRRPRRRPRRRARRSVVDHLASQGLLVYDASASELFAVNAGSDSVSVFGAHAGDRLNLRQVIGSGGSFPASIAVSGNLVYVLNALGGGTIQGPTTHLAGIIDSKIQIARRDAFGGRCIDATWHLLTPTRVPGLQGRDDVGQLAMSRLLELRRMPHGEAGPPRETHLPATRWCAESPT